MVRSPRPLTFGATRNPWNTDSHAGRQQRRQRLPRSPPGWRRWRWVPTAWARSASRRPGAACSGIKPQRDRVPLAPHDDAWYGLSVNGPMARTVEDAALFLDVTYDDARARRWLRRRRGRRTRPATDCVEHQGAARCWWHASGARSGPPSREAGELLRELGHDVVERDPDYPTSAIYRRRLSAALLPGRLRRRADVAPSGTAGSADPRVRPHWRLVLGPADGRHPCSGKPKCAERIQSIFDDVDVVVTPGTATGPPASVPTNGGARISTLLLVAAARSVSRRCSI